MRFVIIVVADDRAPERMAGHGLSDRAKGQAIAAPARCGEVGANAQAHAQRLTPPLLPASDARQRPAHEPEHGQDHPAGVCCIATNPCQFPANAVSTALAGHRGHP